MASSPGCGRDRKDAQLAASDLGPDGRHLRERGLLLSREERLDHRRRALVRDMDDVDSRHVLEQFHAEVGDGTVAAGSVAELAGMRLRMGDEFLHVVDRKRGMNG